MRFDFDFLHGDFDVVGRRLRDALDPTSGWVDVPATSSAIHAFDGAVSIDEMWFPDDRTFGMSLRLWEPGSRRWTVRWLSGTTGVLHPPVAGVWSDGRCWFTGADRSCGHDLLASYAWSDVTAASAHWQQCFSVDSGRTWQPNWTMRFTRRDGPVEHPALPRVTTDFDFLAGTWHVHHRRLLDPVGHLLGRDGDLAEWDGVHQGRTLFAGAVSVDETALLEPGRRGMSVRVHDPDRRTWSIYWVDSGSGRLEPPVHGAFDGGVGTFHGHEQLGGHDVDVRFEWTDITPTTACWQQSFRLPGGDWDRNWVMTFTRPTGPDAR